jgi:DinB superfamily
MDINWNEELVSQLQWHWDNQLRPRLEGLTDDEYFWMPVPDCWTISRRGESTAPISVGGGDLTADFAMEPPDPEPVTTIAWRLAHIIVGVFGVRNASHFGGPPADYLTFSYAGGASEALAQLDEAYAAWIKGVSGLGADGLAQPCGPAEGPFAEYSMAALVLHIHREAIHHGAEIALLRDLYLRRTVAEGAIS